MICVCKEYWSIKTTIYHDENNNPTLSLTYVVYCDHMGSREQVISDIPLGLTGEEWDNLPIQRRVVILEPLVRSREIAEKLAIEGHYDIKQYPCPYCD